MTLSVAYASGSLDIRGNFNLFGPQSDEYEGRGLPADIAARFVDPTVQRMSITYATSDSEHSVVFSRLADDPNFVQPRYADPRLLLTEERVRAWFVSAGFQDITKIYCLVNEYNPQRDDRWWLVSTEIGLVKLGWRSHVINIDWSDTAVRKSITEDTVTKDLHFVHADSIPKAIEYLTALRNLASYRITTNYIATI